ncbi:hypothetical protein [Arenibaculum pallidiluteum]|uniref:hypothetical protein n=1 Tax=Arenibaculum pallidiluteum TaxID=2812559 RepID=UPI001A956738|nr:hypothetical protein [Arenibaculum pallidiluteum]
MPTMTHLEREHRILIEGAIDRVFPLFTPIGEMLWVDGWEPDFIFPESGEARDGMIFRTTHGNEETLWSCIAWDPDAHRVRYARVTPGSRFGFVEVLCRETSPQQTEASIRYILTALSQAGASYLADLTPNAYKQMIDGWRPRIESCLKAST